MQVRFDFCRGKQLFLWQEKIYICVSGFQAIMLSFMPVQKLLHGFISRIFHQKSGQSHNHLGRTIMPMKKWHYIKLSTEWVRQKNPVLHRESVEQTRCSFFSYCFLKRFPLY